MEIHKYPYNINSTTTATTTITTTYWKILLNEIFFEAAADADSLRILDDQDLKWRLRSVRVRETERKEKKREQMKEND